MAVKTISIFVSPGNEYKFTIPSIIEIGAGCHYADSTVVLGEKVSLQKGFRVETPLIGILDDIYDDSLSIKYTHLLPGSNTIWFYALTGEVVQIVVTTMPVHDHASIVTGGPAYGTYYSPASGEEVT